MMAEQAGEQASAMHSYELAMKGNPQDLFIVKHLTALYIKQENWDKAIQTFRIALEYHPNDPYLLERLGTLLVSCPVPAYRNIQEGFDFSERAFINILSHSTILISSGRSLALAYAALGDYKNGSK
jgi:tetratricopeptide (TPR) repeat protein